MTPFLAYAVVAIAYLAAASAAGAAADTVWHDATDFDIEGRGWSATESPYDRLPAAAKGVVPDAVWFLGQDSAGLAVRFLTDAPSVRVRWTLLREPLAMPHMPATGVSGVDLYRRRKDGRWEFVGNGRPEQMPTNEAAFSVGAPGGAQQELLLYLPLYNGVRRVEIGVAAGHHIIKAPPHAAGRQGPIVFYGTSIVQGGCASRPGMAHVAILGRMLDRPVVNLGFSGSGRLEPEVSRVLAELAPAAYVIDCLWNVGDLSQAELASRISTLVRAIRAAHPETPLLFVGQSSIRPSTRPSQASRYQSSAVAKLRADGVHGLYLLGGEGLLGHDDEGTVDGVHPNDLGMMRQAEAMVAAIRGMLREAASRPRDRSEHGLEHDSERRP